MLESLRIVRSELPDDKALIGFSGAPFTLATYLVEGGPSRNYATTKSLMYGQPDFWHELMRRLTDMVTVYLIAQQKAGAQALQLFDSWIGWLSRRDYLEYVFPYTSEILSSVKKTGVPVIHFATGAGSLNKIVRDGGADVLSLDWRTPIDEAWESLGDVAVQGNLDPAVLLAPPDVIKEQTLDVLRRAGWQTGAHLQPWTRVPAPDAAGQHPSRNRLREGVERQPCFLRADFHSSHSGRRHNRTVRRVVPGKSPPGEDGRDFSIALVERDSHLGGKIRTLNEDGFTIEAGPDGFLIRKPWAYQLANDLGLANDIVYTQASGASLLRNGRLHDIPARPDGALPRQAARHLERVVPVMARQAARKHRATGQESRGHRPGVPGTLPQPASGRGTHRYAPGTPHRRDLRRPRLQHEPERAVSDAGAVGRNATAA